MPTVIYLVYKRIWERVKVIKCPGIGFVYMDLILLFSFNGKCQLHLRVHTQIKALFQIIDANKEIVWEGKVKQLESWNGQYQLGKTQGYSWNALGKGAWIRLKNVGFPSILTDESSEIVSSVTKCAINFLVKSHF